MKNYKYIPDKVIRKFAKIKELTNLRGKEIEEIIRLLIEKGYENELNYLNDQFAFSGKIGGLIIEKSIDPFPDEVNDQKKFVSSLIQRKLIPIDGPLKKEWFIDYNDSIQICGIKVEEETVFISTVERRVGSHQTGWNQRGTNEYAYFSTIVLHFENNLIEYRCPITYVTKYKKFVMIELLGMKSIENCERLTKLTAEDAKKVKDDLNAIISSEHILTPCGVGSIKFISSNATVDLEKDQHMELIRTAFKGINLPTDDKADVVCHLENFVDPRTKVSLPFSFEINLKTGGLKFNSSIVTQSAIDHVVDSIVKVSFKDKEEVTI